eukprot:TRINITY_DN27050_c0_g1_i1.p2 TRINITY_DN27050_c0_g1~~TRINITY_DN27050_c0_g1_i1.p2  ORF type:complete len:248 (+),score=50.07 TRINITY_DN27050_c0_g1_i1:248-991(+)
MGITIKCKKCGNENPLGDVFCRQCGEELNLEEIDPRHMKKQRESKRSGCGRWLFEFIGLAIVLSFMGGLFCLFVTPTEFNFSLIDEQVISQGSVTAQRIEQLIDRKIDETSLDVKPDSAGQAFRMLAMKDDPHKKDHVIIKVKDNEVFFAARVRDIVPVTLILGGELIEGNLNDKTHWRLARDTTFKITSAKIGVVPVGADMAPFIKKTFFPFFESEAFNRLRVQLGSITLTQDGDFKISIPTPRKN